MRVEWSVDAPAGQRIRAVEVAGRPLEPGQAYRVVTNNFLRRGGHLRLAMHDSSHLERDCPRFMRLLQDYSHRIECRVTSRPLRTLTDSFCIGDDIHIVRRFHCDHMRGEAAFDNPAAVELPAYRFEALWEESGTTLPPSITGL